MKPRNPKINSRKRLIRRRRAKMRYFYPRARRYGVKSKIFEMLKSSRKS